MYLEETLRREGRFSAQLERDAGDLQKVLGLGVKEAREMRDDLVTKAYRRATRAPRCQGYFLAYFFAYSGSCERAGPCGTRAREQVQEVGRGGGRAWPRRPLLRAVHQQAASCIVSKAEESCAQPLTSCATHAGKPC